MKPFFQSDKTKLLRIIFAIVYFIILTSWSYRQPLGNCPDEDMRYQIPLYIYSNNWSLPSATDTSIIDEKYGFSYASRPFLSAQISAACMKACSLFSLRPDDLYHAARMGNVLLSLIFVLYLFKISDLFFNRPEKKWLFVSLVAFWPQLAFIFTYVNSDALGVLAVAMIVYSLVSCIFLYTLQESSAFLLFHYS